MSTKVDAILAIDTSCDETSAAVVKGRRVLSNVISSQQKLHSKYGGVMPAVARLAHAKKIDTVVTKALEAAGVEISGIAVTAGPGLAIALEVGINYAALKASELGLPLYKINHMEGHLLSAAAENSNGNSSTIVDAKNLSGALGLLISGKHSEFIHINAIGEYQKLGEALDDACGEAFDKSARLLGLGYPGGRTLSQFAADVRTLYEVRSYNNNGATYVGISSKSGAAGIHSGELVLPIPMANSGDLNMSFSGLKTAFWQLVAKLDSLSNKETLKSESLNIPDAYREQRMEGVSLSLELVKALSLLFEEAVAKLFEVKLSKALLQGSYQDVLLGGGVAANAYLRSRLRQVCKDNNSNLHIPYGSKLYMDNAAMIGVAANLRIENRKIKPEVGYSEIDRIPNWSIDNIV